MPALDMSDAFDPDILDSFDVIRNKETVSDQGRSVITSKTYRDKYGVVTAATDNDFKRAPEMDFSTKSINIVTEFRLQMVSLGYKADNVIWNGDTYIVMHVDDYSSYGPGFIQAIASSIDYNDQPPNGDAGVDVC